MPNRSDSLHEKVRIMRAAGEKIEPPKHLKLNKQERVFFDHVINAKMQWSELEATHAVNLARTLSAIQEQQKLLDAEGYVKDSDKGAYLNPRHKAVEALTRRSLSLCRLLNIHAAATQGRARDQANKNSEFRKAAESLVGLDDLIPRTEH